MKIYLAGLEALYDEELEYLKKNPTNGLASFYTANSRVEEVMPYLRNFLLDSGAFSLFSKGKNKEVDWDSYIERYAAFIKKNRVERFFELDIDKLVGYEKVLDLRHKLEDKVGLPVIPVWHVSRGLDKYEEMCEQYKYVAVGGLVSKEFGSRMKPILRHLIRDAHKHNAIIHGLGFTGKNNIKEIHFDSVDSTSWTAGNRFGFLYKFNGKEMAKTPVPKGYRISKDSVRQFRCKNLQEWVKFVDYAEHKL